MARDDRGAPGRPRRPGGAPVEIVAEIRQHLADAQRATLNADEADRLVRELARIARRTTLEPPVLAFEFRGNRQNPDPIWREIVGVVAHVRHYGLASEPPFLQVYTPFDQPLIWFEQRRPSMALVARTPLPAETLTAAIRREVAGIDRDIPVYGIETMRT